MVVWMQLESRVEQSRAEQQQHKKQQGWDDAV